MTLRKQHNQNMITMLFDNDLNGLWQPTYSPHEALANQHMQRVNLKKQKRKFP